MKKIFITQSNDNRNLMFFIENQSTQQNTIQYNILKLIMVFIQFISRVYKGCVNFLLNMNSYLSNNYNRN